MGVSLLTVSETSLRQENRNVKRDSQSHTVISSLGQGGAITAKRPEEVVQGLREEQALSVAGEQNTR